LEAQFNDSTAPPLLSERGLGGEAGIYLHIPFCDTKCIYCDFYSITNHTNKNRFITSLLKEIEYYSPLLKNHKFDTIFFGGGTPSLLPVEDFNRIFESLYKHYSISGNSEITIEANPGTLDKKKLTELKQLPINRISFGVQSFNDDDLKFLTRIHSSEEAINTVKSAQDAGYNNINIDLIFALHNQTVDAWKYNLDKAVSIGTQHISAYSLIFEEGTVLNNMKRLGQVSSADIELESDMFDYTSSFLQANGYEHYEISNYAKPGMECRHNLKYWQCEEYISFGPSASSYVGKKRWTNIKNLLQYIDSVQLSNYSKSDKSDKSVIDFEEEITNEKAITEYIFLGLRSTGIDLARFHNIFNFNFNERYLTAINTLITGGFAKVENNRFSLTQQGYAVCDEIVAKYF